MTSWKKSKVGMEEVVGARAIVAIAIPPMTVAVREEVECSAAASRAVVSLARRSIACPENKCVFHMQGCIFFVLVHKLFTY